MSACTKWVDSFVIGCKIRSNKLSYECSQWKDEGEYKCKEYRDEGYSECAMWGQDCHWYTFWNCVVEWFCYGWYWVSSWVCIGWYWAANLVCQIGAWLLKAVCVLFGWIVKPICKLWDSFICLVTAAVRGVVGVFSTTTGPGTRVEHVFVLMLENRSFDHMLGFRYAGSTSDPGSSGGHGHGGGQGHGHGHDNDGQGQGDQGGGNDGKNGTAALPCNDGFDPEVNQNEGVLVQTGADYSLRGIDSDPGHEFGDTLTSLCGKGALYKPVPGGYPRIDNSGFIENYRHPTSPDGKPASTPERIMRCFEPSRLPVLNALADEFVVCDNWFSSLPGPTFPNRFFAMAATSGGLDDSPGKWDIVLGTTIEGYRFENGNIFDALDGACKEWRIYKGDDFPVSFVLNGMNLNELTGRLKDFEEFASDVSDPGFSDSYVFIEPKYGLHEFDITGPGDFACGNSMHPLDDVTSGEKLIKDVYEAIRNSPHWETSLLIVTFDEHGGFYDHVAPPVGIPPGDAQTPSYVHNNFLFDRLGVRVPALVISPYVKRGICDHTVYDHGSIPATIERVFGMSALTARDRAAHDVLPLLSLETPRLDTSARLPNPAVNPNPLDCDDVVETVFQTLEKWSALNTAMATDSFGERRARDFPIKRSQIGFLQVALLRILADAEEPERSKWIEEYNKVETGVDAAALIEGAKLKLRHGIDVKRFEREDKRMMRERVHRERAKVRAEKAERRKAHKERRDREKP